MVLAQAGDTADRMEGSWLQRISHSGAGTASALRKTSRGEAHCGCQGLSTALPGSGRGPPYQQLPWPLNAGQMEALEADQLQVSLDPSLAQSLENRAGVPDLTCASVSSLVEWGKWTCTSRPLWL